MEDGPLQARETVCYKWKTVRFRQGRRSATNGRWSATNGRRSATNGRQSTSDEEDGLLQMEDGLLQTRKTVCRLSFPVSHQPSVIPPASQHQQHVTDCLPPVQLWICGNQHHQSSAQGPQWCTRQPGSSSSCGTDCMPVRSGCVECCRAAQTPGHPQVPGCSVSASHLIHTSVTHPLTLQPSPSPAAIIVAAASALAPVFSSAAGQQAGRLNPEDVAADISTVMPRVLPLGLQGKPRVGLLPKHPTFYA